ncbi:6416_t:CDS:2, partial [Entrophospora sp. SA101]
RIYFVNNQDIPIQIPNSITLRDTVNNANVPRLVVGGAQSFMISWISNYVLLRNGVEVFSLENQKQQALRGVEEDLGRSSFSKNILQEQKQEIDSNQLSAYMHNYYNSLSDHERYSLML